MNSKNSLPCKQCVCIPVCKNKEYGKLVSECKILDKFLYFQKDEPANRSFGLTETRYTISNRRDKKDESIVALFNYLKPNRWYLEQALDRFGRYEVKFL